MKNLKKVLALVVVFSMMLCSVAFAAFPDVAEDADYSNAVNTLAALGIIGGDDQGNFNPDNTITRAEFTKIICEMQGLKGDGNKGVTAFTDVAADHWASGYINMATNMGIINGMGDGTFAPESPVTYEQAIKMIVVALGYEPIAAEKGGYPTGYLVIAQSQGITANVTAPAQADAAKRSLIAELVYAALDTPMMEKISYGSDPEYAIQDGNNKRERVTLLTSKFDVVKLGGVVIGNEKVNLENVYGISTMDGTAGEGEITLAYDNNYKSTDKDFELEDRDDVNKIDALVGDTKADEFFGMRVIAFIRDNGKEYEVIAIVAEDGKNDSIEFALSDIDDGDRTDLDSANKKLAYFESDTAKRSTQVKLASGCNLIWNSVKDGYTVDDLDDDLTLSAKVTLIDWNADDEYDMIKVDQYVHYVVDEIDADIYTIETLNGDSIVLDPEDDELLVAIEDVDGNAVAFENIAEGDVLAVISDNAANPTMPVNFIEITVLGKTAVEGTIKAVDNNTAAKKVTIDGAKYAIDGDCYQASKLNIGAEGLFYIGIDGQIVAFDGAKAASGNYALLLQAADASSSFNNGYQVKLLNKDGQVVVYDLAKKLKLKNGDDTINVEIDDVIASNFFANTEFASLHTNGDTLADFLDEFAALPASDAAIAQRMVQVKINSSNEVTEIIPASNVKDTFTVAMSDPDEEYNATTMKFGSFGKVDSSALIFAINDNDIEKSKVITADALVDEAPYTLAGFDKEDGVFAAAIILDGGNSLAGSNSGMAIVTAISETKDANDDDAYEISVVSNGEKEAKTILVTADTLVDNDYNAGAAALDLAENMGVGSLLFYSADEAGNATVIASIANIVKYAGVESYDFVIDENAAYDNGDITFKYGITTGKLTNDLATTDGEIAIESATNKYRYNNATRNKKIEVGAYKGGNVVTANAAEGNFVVAMLVEGDVIDIISIDSRVANLDTIDAADIELAPAADPAYITNGDVEVAQIAYNAFDVTLLADAITPHNNAEGTEGKWIGFKVAAPAGATKADVVFGDDTYNNVSFDEIDGDDCVALYVNAADDDAKDYAEITFEDADGAVTYTYVFTINVD